MSEEDDAWVKKSAPTLSCKICDTPGVVDRLIELLEAVERAKTNGKPFKVSIQRIGRKLMKEIPELRCADSTFRRAFIRHREVCND